MTKDERIKELESVATQLFDMVHESENIQNKIKANDLYDTIIGQSLPIDSVSHQRRLLESFRDWLNNTKTSDNNINNGDLDDFLEDYNCG